MTNICWNYLGKLGIFKCCIHTVLINCRRCTNLCLNVDVYAGRKQTTNNVIMIGIFVGLCAGFVTDLIVSLGGA